MTARGILAGLAVVAACTGAPPPASVREAAPAWHARPPGGTQPIDPGPAPTELLDARGCARCHAEIVAEWATSRHALAWTNSIFQREYGARPQPWCVNCHAPLVSQQRDLAGRQAAQGVDCATCHVRRGRLVSARRAASSPHATIVDASFGSPAFCADCHQFTFPVLDRAGRVERMTAHPMQTTVASFAAGPFAREPTGCLACHSSRHGHAFPGAHDATMRESALEVTWCRDAEALAVTVRNTGAGHHVPSGDIHRHLYLRVWRPSAPEAMFQAYFGRRFEPAGDGGKREIWNSTIGPGDAKRFAIAPATLGGDAAEPVQLELVYVYLEDEFPRERLAEPARSSIVRRGASLAELPACTR